MFSGKSEELIRRLKRAKIARLKVQVFKPSIDNRYSHDHIVSHSEMRHESGVVESAADILAQIEPGTEVVGIDEGQFFDNELVAVANELARRGVRVIIAGLDQDYTGQPFEPMPQLSPSPSTSPRRTPSASAAASRQLLASHRPPRRPGRRRRLRRLRGPLPPLLRPPADAPTSHIE